MRIIVLILIFSFGSSLAITITVSNTNDAGAGSLRQAVASAGSGDVINFSIGTGLQSIQLTSGDIIVSQSITIDGTTQSGFSCASPNPKIEIWGSSGNGLFINANSVTIRSLCINRCSQNGIYINGDNVTIEGCYVGVNPAGTLDQGNSSSGILLAGNADNLTVGGTTLCKRNIISGNNNHGIEINGTSTSILIQNNFIGTDVTGLLDIGNSQHGIRTFNSSSITIGGSVAARNIISGNDNQGLDIETCSAVIIRSNYIGLGNDGSTACGNGFTGVTIRTNCSNVQVGGSAAGQGNVIGANAGMGIDAISSSAIVIKQNYIGVTANGLTARGNNIHGVQIIGCPATVIGGDRTTEGNIISNSSIHGINYDPNGDGGVIQGNLIGTDLNGTAAFGNSIINIVAKSNNMLIGGSTANLGNVILDAKHATVGVGLLLANANNAVVRRNLIGVGLDGTTARGNAACGINISVEDAGQSANNNIIEFNTIANNRGHGVSIGDALPVAALGAGGYSGCEAEDQNRVVRNSIYCNTFKGINLNKTGCDAGNIDRATPVINSGTATAFFLQGTANANDSIHIYAQGNCVSCSQGKTFIAGVKADGAGNWSYSTATPFGGQTTVTATDAVNNTSEFATCVSLPLPVAWLYIKAEQKGLQNVVEWSTMDEKNNSFFVVEKSTDGIHFEPIGVIPGKGSVSSISMYSFEDEAGMAYYRVQQVDVNGQFAYSQIVQTQAFRSVSYYPNPAQSYLTINLAENTTVRISDVLGRTVWELRGNAGSSIEVNLENEQPGYYSLEASFNGIIERYSFVKTE